MRIWKSFKDLGTYLFVQRFTFFGLVIQMERSLCMTQREINE